jgi:hypothetical protein
MSRIKAFLAFLYDFVIGDDPAIALVVAVALGVTAAVAGSGIPAWWILPLAVLTVLSVSLRRATRS